MPPQDKIDSDVQLSIYLKAFLERYPEEAANLKNIKVSLYYLKHNVKLSSTRTEEQLEELKKSFLEIIAEIEKEKFEPNVTPLCDWCGFQKNCPMWRHKFKEERKIDTEEVNKAIEDYIKAKDEAKSIRYKIAELQNKISDYMDQEGVERVFSDNGIIARTSRKSYKYNENEVKKILEPIGKWDSVVKINTTMLKSTMKTLPQETRKKIEETQEIDKESKSFSIKK